LAGECPGVAEGCAPGPAAAGLIEPYKAAKERVLNRFTVRYVSELLEKTGGNITRAAELSGLTRVALQKIRRRLGGSASHPDDSPDSW
jgi:DNA-binding NtrC family response regulator